MNQNPFATGWTDGREALLEARDRQDPALDIPLREPQAADFRDPDRGGTVGTLDVGQQAVHSAPGAVFALIQRFVYCYPGGNVDDSRG